MAKPTKRILNVTVKKLYDEDPDTSWLGEYSDTPTSEYTIDRATDEFHGDQELGREWLDRMETRVSDERESFVASATWCNALDAAIDTVRDLRHEIGDNPAAFDSKWMGGHSDFRYFNGPVENYEGDTPENIRKYVRQDYERMEGVNNGDWCFMGVRAEAEVIVDFKHAPSYHGLTQTVTSGGIWGNESDMPKCDWQEVYSEQLAELKDQLLALGFSRRAIATAFKSVEYKEGE